MLSKSDLARALLFHVSQDSQTKRGISVSKTNPGLFFVVAFRPIVLLVLFLSTSAVALSSVQTIQGRWEFAITSGDTNTQLNSMGQSTISTYLLQNGSSLSNIVAFTTDTIACDTQSDNNVTVSSGSIDAQGNVVVSFTITLAGQTPFQYVFTGVLTPGTSTSPTVITGTYQRTAGGCTQGSLGTGTPDGNFVATYFPDLSGTWDGQFDGPDMGSGPTGVPASFTLTTNADETLSGTVSAPGLTNTVGDACFAGPVTLQTGMPEGVSEAAGVAFQLFGTDANGTRAWVLGWATNPDGSTAAVGEDNPADGNNGTVDDGTNNSYSAYYGISGGPCDGLGGGDAPFKLVAKKKSHRDRDPHKERSKALRDKADSDHK